MSFTHPANLFIFPAANIVNQHINNLIGMPYIDDIVIITVHTSQFNECVAAEKSQVKSYNLLATLTSIN